MTPKGFVSCLLLLVATSLTACRERSTLWIYNSLQRESVAELDAMARKQFPELNIKWFSGGSERIASTVQAELRLNAPRADLILAADPFLYDRLKQSNALLPYHSPAAPEDNGPGGDPEHAYATVRMMLVVIGVNTRVLTLDRAPKTWVALSEPRFRNQISVASPELSGTSYVALTLLSEFFGWNYLRQLRQNGMLTGGESPNVMTRIELGKMPVGMTLLEYVLQSRRNGHPVAAVFPADGSLMIPGGLAIMRATRHAAQAKEVYDWLFSQSAQRALLRNGMYSPVLDQAPSPELRPWSQLRPAPLSVRASLLRSVGGGDATRTRLRDLLM